MNGPPSSGQHVNAGRRSRRTSDVTCFDNRPLRDAAAADLDQLETNVARAPQPGCARGKQRLGQLHEASDQTQRPVAERQFRPARSAEQIRDQPEVGAGDIGEQQRRAAGRDDAPMNLGDFQSRVDGGFDRDEVAVPAEALDERTEVGK